VTDYDPDPEGPSEADVERFGSETALCPQCGAAVWDQATICNNCGAVLDSEGGKKMPVWVFVATILALIAFALVFVL